MLRTVCKVSRISRDTLHLPCFTLSMLRAYCYSAMKVPLNGCKGIGVSPICLGSEKFEAANLAYDAALAIAGESATG